MKVYKVSRSHLDPVQLLHFPRAPHISAPLTIAFVALATLARYLIGLYEPKTLIFATYYPAICAVTLLCGRAWGYTSVVLSAVIANWLFMVPTFEFTFTSKSAVINVALYIVCVALVVEIACAYLAALKRVEQKRTRLAQQNAQIEILARELQHRSRNLATVIGAIVRQVLKGNSEATEAILGRIRALQSDDLLDTSPDGTADLHAIISQSLGSYDEAQVVLRGDAVHVTRLQARAVSMVIHELATNAAKYGALSRPEGRVAVTWSKGSDALELEWTERGGPEVSAAPERTGFGTFLIERMLSDQNGRALFTYEPSGLSCRITLDLPTAAATVQQRVG